MIGEVLVAAIDLVPIHARSSLDYFFVVVVLEDLDEGGLVVLVLLLATSPHGPDVCTMLNAVTVTRSDNQNWTKMSPSRSVGDMGESHRPGSMLSVQYQICCG